MLSCLCWIFINHNKKLLPKASDIWTSYMTHLSVVVLTHHSWDVLKNIHGICNKYRRFPYVRFLWLYSVENPSVPSETVQDWHRFPAFLRLSNNSKHHHCLVLQGVFDQNKPNHSLKMTFHTDNRKLDNGATASKGQQQGPNLWGICYFLCLRFSNK